MICPNCGKEINDKTVVCPFCNFNIIDTSKFGMDTDSLKRKSVIKIISSVILFLLVFNLKIGENNALFTLLSLVFIVGLILFVQGMYSIIKQVFRKIDKQAVKDYINKNKITIGISFAVILMALIPTTNYFLTKPLEMYCQTDKFGSYYVKSSKEDKFFYTLFFTSDYYVESWRAGLVSFLASDDTVKLELAPKLILNNEIIKLNASGGAEEKMILTLKIRYNNGFNPFVYHNMNSIFKDGLENGSIKLEFNNVFTRPKSEQIANLKGQKCSTPSSNSKKININKMTLPQRLQYDYDTDFETIYKSMENIYKNNKISNDEDLHRILWDSRDDSTLVRLMPKIEFVDKSNYKINLYGMELKKEDIYNGMHGGLDHIIVKEDFKFIDRIKDLLEPQNTRYDL